MASSESLACDAGLHLLLLPPTCLAESHGGLVTVSLLLMRLPLCAMQSTMSIASFGSVPRASHSMTQRRAGALLSPPPGRV